MIGDWTKAVAERTLRDETFALVFSPALADVQFEVSTQRFFRRLRARVSVIEILMRALSHDVGRDLTLIVSRDVRRTVWMPTLACFVGLFLFFLTRRLSAGLVVHQFGMVTHLPLPPAGDGLELFIAGICAWIALSCIAYATVPAVFLISRQTVETKRATAAAVIVLVLATSVIGLLSRPVRASSDLIGSAMAETGGADPTGRRRLADVIRSEVVPRRAEVIARYGDVFEKQNSWHELHAGLRVPIFALLAVALSRSRGWRLGARAVAMIAMWYALNRWAVPVLDVLIVPMSGWPHPALRALPTFLVLPLVAAAFLVRMPRLRHAAERRA